MQGVLRTRLLRFAGALCATVTASVSAQQAAFPLGPLATRAEAEVGSPHATVLEVEASGPGAVGGLRVGDRIVAASGEAFPPHDHDVNSGGHGPMQALGAALGAARTGDGKLVLTVERDDERIELTVDLATAPAWTGRFDATCVRTTRFLDGIAADLRGTQRDDGSWQSRTGDGANRYVSALAGLALLGRGDASDRDRLERLARYLAHEDGKAGVSDDFMTPAGLSNWWLCATGIYLAEFTLAFGSDEFLPTIRHLVDTMAARQDPDGKYGHGISTGYSGRGFNVINTHAHLLWALAARVDRPVAPTAWERSFAQIRQSIGNGGDQDGGVRYWTSQTGYWDASARTGQMALALDLTGKAPELRDRMAGYLLRNTNRSREAHAMSSIGLIFSTAALARVDREAWREHMDAWRWYFELCERPDGSAAYLGGKRNNGGDGYLRFEHAANAMVGMMLASGRNTLHLFGNDRRGWLADD